MIKNFKLFENNENKPQIGDYVVLNYKDNYRFSPGFRRNIQYNINDFLNGCIGKICLIIEQNKVGVSYEKIPNNLLDFFYKNNYYTIAYLEEIEKYSSSKEELELYLQAKKYNL